MTEDPMSEIEILKSMRDQAQMVRAFYEQCVTEGFAPAEALTLSEVWLRAMIQGVMGGQGHD